MGAAPTAGHTATRAVSKISTANDRARTVRAVIDKLDGESRRRAGEKGKREESGLEHGGDGDV